MRKAFGEDACDTILSKLWEAFAKKRMEIAIASEFGMQDTRYLAFQRSGLRAARDHSNAPMLRTVFISKFTQAMDVWIESKRHSEILQKRATYTTKYRKIALQGKGYLHTNPHQSFLERVISGSEVRSGSDRLTPAGCGSAQL